MNWFHGEIESRRIRFGAALWLACIIAPTAAVAAQPAESTSHAPRFEEHILPILTAHCLKCHGLEARQANLDLRTVGLMRKGGDNGPVLDATALDKSLLLKRIVERSMPPEKELPLNDEKIDLIRRWIAAGAVAENPEAHANA